MIVLFYALGQPKVNHRVTSLTNVKDRMIPAALQRRGGLGIGYEEETYGLFYEVVTPTRQNKTPYNGVPIYCVYNTESSSEPEMIQKQHAIFPTRKGIFDMLKYLQLDDFITKYYSNTASWNENEPFLPQELVKELFEQEIFTKMTYSEYYFSSSNKKVSSKVGANQRQKNDTWNQAIAYRRAKDLFQKNCNIRIAMIGGLHRTTAVCHLYANIKPTPNETAKIPKRDEVIDAIPLSEKMVLNAAPVLTVLSPQDLEYTDEYIQQVKAYSYRVEKRKDVNLKPTHRSITLHILDTEKHNDIKENKRFCVSDVFMNKSEFVSKSII